MLGGEVESWRRVAVMRGAVRGRSAGGAVAAVRGAVAAYLA